MRQTAPILILPMRCIINSAVQAATGSAGRVEPTCLYEPLLRFRTFVQPEFADPRQSTHGGFSMARLPERPNFEHLKKQAKDLLRLYNAKDATAFTRFRESLPAANGKD